LPSAFADLILSSFVATGLHLWLQIQRRFAPTYERFLQFFKTYIKGQSAACGAKRQEKKIRLIALRVAHFI
jgi:hypothetical protein